MGLQEGAAVNYRQSDLVATPTGKLGYVAGPSQEDRSRVVVVYLAGEGAVELKPELLRLMGREDED